MLDVASPADNLESTGNAPDVKSDLSVKNRSISSVDQAYQVCDTLIEDWSKGIKHAARITAKLNGERPYNQRDLKNAGKSYKTNINTGFLQTETSKVLPRFFMPLKTAKYLTAASLPAGWPEGERKTAHYRSVITKRIKSWKKYNFYIRGLAREVGVFGFAYNVWFDKYEWKPTLIRMDRGFVPQGTEVMEDPAFFMVKWDYKPSELLDLLKANKEAGLSDWKQDHVIEAIKSAITIPAGTTRDNIRTYEDLIRQSAYTFSYAKGTKVISTYHLFSQEADGKVSHYVLLSPEANPASNKGGSNFGEGRLLYEQLDEFDAMSDCVHPIVFDYGDGTIHGSWGAGQILYDLSVAVERVRCDSIDNMRQTNKMKLQVADAKNVTDVKLNITDTMMIVSGATFAGNTAAMPQDIQGYELLDQKLSQIAQQKIGAFVPPIPLQPSDVKAAQVNAQLSKEKEIQEALLENWLIQNAGTNQTISKRLCDSESPYKDAKDTRKELLEVLTADEIIYLSKEAPVQSVMEFTEYAAQQRGMFAASVKGDPLFRQSTVARIMAEGAGDQAFVDSIVLKDGDQSEIAAATNKQLCENAALNLTQPVPVLQDDNDWVHMKTLAPALQALIKAGKVEIAQVSLQHYAAHYNQGVNKKTLPKEEINNQKSFIASAEKTIMALREQQAIQQHAQQVRQQAELQAQQIVQQEQQPGQPTQAPTPEIQQ